MDESPTDRERIRGLILIVAILAGVVLAVVIAYAIVVGSCCTRPA